MYAITLPGFGDTAPLPIPPEKSRYAETPWIQSTVSAIVKLFEQEHIERVTIVAHWALSTQIALRLALEHPDRVESVILVGGVLKVYYDNSPAMLNWTENQRSQFVEGMSQRWFKTVTRRTWDDNNFMSYDYAINPRRGLFLWREAQAPSLTVWIRYLLEFYSVDLAPQLKDLRVPTLVVQPGFDDPAFYVDDKRNYMRNLCLDSWKGAEELSKQLKFVKIAGSRLFVMLDQPEEFDRVLNSFFNSLPAGKN
jgi:pimeloyl-ACP methyl ester carboxylesterase